MKKALISFIILAMQIPFISACNRNNLTQLTQPTEKHSSSKEATDGWYNKTYTWCKGHKQGLKRGAIYACEAGVVLLAVFLIINNCRAANPANADET